ncbi:hypothetical protein NPS53_08120 [Pseudomonas putida]|uniref:hypothetical protein n=1 Tax=Pseudomonas putida TaxID=303 RepID=UPI0023648EAA|nr:hypothetical protein [Pseudomonas putida]MDD2139536.1 hypothetical protein [Pseudomonas putida]HDS1721459.1 hypothetical protein [Pseudomonas putida]
MIKQHAFARCSSPQRHGGYEGAILEPSVEHSQVQKEFSIMVSASTKEFRALKKPKSG